MSSLKALFDASAYLTDKSDIVALLVFEHQAHVGGFITRANFKSRTLLAQKGLDASTATWASLPADVQKPMKAMLEPLVRSMLFSKAVTLADKVTSTSGFDQWFEAQGPRDPKGQSLREFDLTRRVFQYPLSYLVYSGGFEGLPGCGKEYVYARFAEVLSGKDRSAAFSHLSENDRSDVWEILASTMPAFAKVVGASSAVASD